MERSDGHGVEFVVLFTASAIVYHQVTDESLAAMDLAQFNAVLHDVARALASAGPIYSLDEKAGKYTRIPAEELAAATFAGGATLLRTPRAEYRNLAILRTDMRAAIAEFRRTGVRFRPAPGSGR
jgi:hypothetical protein